MANIEKPDMSTLWAEDGAIITPSNEKIAMGWIAEVPPHQWENYAQNRQDQAIAYLLQKGIPEWDAETEYQEQASFVQYDGVLYFALRTNTNAIPSESPEDWKDLQAVATEDTEGVVALASNAETQAGVVNNKAVTPASLQSKVTSSPTDTTAGRLLKVGDFGVGAANLTFLSNLNVMTTRTGVYLASSASTVGTFPPSAPTLGIVQVLANQGGAADSQWIKQVFYDLGSDRTWQRYSVNNGPWSTWVEGMQILQSAPAEDRGPVYVVGEGVMVWDASAEAYVSQEKNISSEFFGGTAPSPTWPGMVWADTGSGKRFRRNEANDAWVEEAKLFQPTIPIFEAGDVPVENIGPIYVPETGLMEWDDATNGYVARAGGATGGGADQVFYENDAQITTSYTIKSGKNAGTFGPIEIMSGAEVTVEPGAVWTIV